MAEGGYTSAMESLARQRLEAQQLEQIKNTLAFDQWKQQQAKEQQARQDEARQRAAMTMGQISAPPGQPQGNPPQPPPPGVSSAPMMPPRPQPMPMGPQAGPPQVPPPPPMGAQVTAMPQPSGWKPSPAAGGPPPPPPQGAAPPGGGMIPPPPTPQGPPGGAGQQPQMSISAAIEALKKSGAPPEKQFDALEQMLPFIQAQNKEEVEQYKIALTAQGAATRAYEATIKAMNEQRLQEQGAAKIAQRAPLVEAQTNKLNRAGGAGGSGKPGGLTSDALDDAADQYNASGTIPAMYRDTKGREAIINRAAERRRSGATSDIAGDRAGFKADAESLKQRQKFVDAGNQFVKNMQAQADLVDGYMTKGAAGGVPVLNKWIQAGRKQVAGDPDVTALDTAIRGLAREHQRIVTGVTSNAQLHVAAQHTADELLNTAQTPAQIRAAIKVMREEATNAVKAGTSEVADIRGRMRGEGKGAAAGGNADVPLANGKGWKLHTDKDGNKAYVSPDGKQYEEVK